MSVLFTPINLGDVQMRNRFIHSATYEMYGVIDRQAQPSRLVDLSRLTGMVERPNSVCATHIV